MTDQEVCPSCGRVPEFQGTTSDDPATVARVEYEGPWVCTCGAHGLADDLVEPPDPDEPS